MEGYDAKFHPPLEKRLECPICLLAQRDPMQTPCGHRFCAVCIQRALRETGPRCPVDNSRVLSSQLFHDNFAKREVLSLRVSCHGDDEGCNWKGELRELEFHSQQCQFILIDCPNGCSYKCNRKQMTHHVTECPNKLLPCLTCSLCFSATRLEEHNINCSKIKLPQSVLHNLEQNGETVQWCGMLHWMVMGREIQTNCFLASYNNRNHSHLITSGWKNFIKVYPFVHPNIKSFLHQLRLSSGDVTPLSFYFLSQDHASNQFLQQLKRHACSGVGFVDRGSTSGHNVMFFTWNDARKKIAAFTVELRGPKLKELLNYLRRTKDTAHHRTMIQRTDRAGYAQGSSSANPMLQNGPHHPRQQLPTVSASYPPPLLPSSQQPQGAGLQPYSSTSGILPDLLSWHMSQSLQPWSIQAAAPTGSFFTFPATPPQFIPSNTYSSPYTFAPFPAIASHFPIGTLPALSTVPTAINLPYTGVAAVPQVPQVPNYVGAIRSSMGEAPADVPPHEQPGGDISVIPITRDIFLVGAHHNNSASVNYSSNSNNREDVALVSNRRAEQFHHHQHQDVPSPPSSSPERSEDLSSPSSLASILMNSPSPLSTSPSIPVLSPSRSRTPSPNSSVATSNTSPSRYCPDGTTSNSVSPATDDNSSQPGPSSRTTDQPMPPHGSRNSTVILQRHSSMRNSANHQSSSQLPQQHADTQDAHYHDQVTESSARQQQAAVLASPLHTLATAAVIVEQNSLATNPRDHQLVGTVMPTRQILSQQIPHIVAMGNMAAAAAAVAHNTNNNQNSSAAVRAPPTSLNADQTSMIYNYGHFVDNRAQNETLVDSPVNFGLGSPSFVHNIFAWPTVAAAPPPGMQAGQALQNEIPDDLRQRSSMWNSMMQSATGAADGRTTEQVRTTQ